MICQSMCWSDTCLDPVFTTSVLGVCMPSDDACIFGHCQNTLHYPEVRNDLLLSFLALFILCSEFQETNK